MKRQRDVTLRRATGFRLRRKRCPRVALDVLGGGDAAVCIHVRASRALVRLLPPEEETAEGAIMCHFRHAVTVYIVPFRVALLAIRNVPSNRTTASSVEAEDERRAEVDTRAHVDRAGTVTSDVILQYYYCSIIIGGER